MARGSHSPGAAPLARQANGCIEVSGFPQDRAELNGRYRREGSSTGGRAADKSRKGQHLFWHPETDRWLLSSNPYDPAKKDSVAFIAARGGPVPAGARAWSVFTGGKWVDRELTVREVGGRLGAAEEAAAEAAALDAADAAAAEGLRLEEVAQADRGATLSFHIVISHCHWLPLAVTLIY
jgi:hypothetical protein